MKTHCGGCVSQQGASDPLTELGKSDSYQIRTSNPTASARQGRVLPSAALQVSLLEQRDPTS
jgi:hypothetical protein